MDSLRIILEIVIILTAVWYLYRTFRGTRGGMAFVGAGMLFAVLIALVFIFKLDLIRQFLLDSYWFIIVALMVVFQPELRRLFVGVGESIFQRGKANQSFVIEHIVRCVAQLQDKDFGALIAVERRPTNRAIHENGVAVDGKVTEELLATIFTDRTPLHDGGVIISGDKILVAGCIFPLTVRQDLDRNLGLRHRAALGFSGESDVVVVVLSEERGEISIAFKGVLERNLTHDELRQRLTELLLPKKVKTLPADGEPTETNS
ncbi:MAG: diadenylate cyclase [Verrucomicrobiales bacterium]|jgi:diadenylate cyclase|nr:diadenylate cyclase [Verrucomicrobiales bacterium]